VTKLQIGAFLLAAALVVTMASASLLGIDLQRRHRPSGHAGAVKAAGGVPARRAPASAPADASRVAPDWPTARVVLAARLEKAQRAKAAAHRRHRPRTVRLCRPYQHVAAFGADGAGLVVRNDNYGGRRECLANVNRWANFTVISSQARRTGDEPAAFPDIFYGCSWGVCSPGTKLPKRLSRLRNPVTSWYTAGHPRGRWDAAYDIWFAKQRHMSGQDRGAEIMLWLRTGGLGRPGSRGLVIDRRHWEVEHWTTTDPVSGRRWPLIIFRMVHPRGFVRHLALMPFFRRAESLGLLQRSWWLTAIEAGFEVWRGGAGLRTTSFWVRP